LDQKQVRKQKGENANTVSQRFSVSLLSVFRPLPFSSLTGECTVFCPGLVPFSAKGVSIFGRENCVSRAATFPFFDRRRAVFPTVRQRFFDRAIYPKAVHCVSKVGIFSVRQVPPFFLAGWELAAANSHPAKELRSLDSQNRDARRGLLASQGENT
jgi:hypothetical protein